MFRDFYTMADDLHRAILPEWRYMYALSQLRESWDNLRVQMGKAIWKSVDPKDYKNLKWTDFG